jgi:putative toxin-antitoxin system antitoxin component (TIGR02293 family)
VEQFPRVELQYAACRQTFGPKGRGSRPVAPRRSPPAVRQSPAFLIGRDASTGVAMGPRDQARRLSHGRLTPEQSDRLVRVVRVLAAAEETFGSQDNASRWLRRPTKVLEGEAPLEMLDTTEGAREVEDLLHRIDHGLPV